MVKVPHITKSQLYARLPKMGTFTGSLMGFAASGLFTGLYLSGLIAIL